MEGAVAPFEGGKCGLDGENVYCAHLLIVVCSRVWSEKSILLDRHVFAKPSDCPVLASYQMWFCQKMLKNAKTNSKIVKIWLFL